MSTGVPANSNVRLSGKQGYLTGPGELDTICDKLYTTSKGTARSMNIDDVTRILGYTGENGAYHPHTTDIYTPTPEAKTITEIAKEIGYDMSSFANTTPESGKTIGDYYSDYYIIVKTNDVYKMKNPEYVDFIYPNSGVYWLASSDVYAYFNEYYAIFGVRVVSQSQVIGGGIFKSKDVAEGFSFSLRPVVALNSDVRLKKVSSGVWSIQD